MNSSELIKKLEELGWREVRCKGSHHHFRNENSPLLITVKHPEKDIPIGTLRDILKKGLK
jgi:predicted RNA binding protein YcfA (HicA-like mRNA interferase family)